MNEEFTLPVTFNYKEFGLTARLFSYGYSFKMEVDLEGIKVLFEPDEEQNWRALISADDLQANKKINAELLKAVAAAIDEIIK